MPERNSYLLPIVIVVAGIILAVAIYIVRSTAHAPLPEGDVTLLRPVSTLDHIAGNPTASVIVVEYSDIDCAYCKSFQEAMTQLITDYSASGSIAWVYRHFPLVDIYKNSAQHAEAAECVASLGGEPLFFRFIDALHQASPNINQFNPARYAEVVKSLGVSVVDFQTCIEGTKFEKRITDDAENALAIGATGAPYSIILIKGHDPISVPGAIPYDALKKIIETALQQASTPAE